MSIRHLPTDNKQLAAKREANEKSGALHVSRSSPCLQPLHAAGAGGPAVLGKGWRNRECCPRVCSSCCSAGAQSQDIDPCPPRHPGGHSHAPTPQGWAEPQWQTTGAPRSAQTPFPQELLRGPVSAVMVFQWKAGASLSLTAYDKYGACCQGKIYPFLSFYQLSNMFDFSQALSVAGI